MKGYCQYCGKYREIAFIAKSNTEICENCEEKAPVRREAKV